MGIDFAASATGTLGIEWELALVERDTLELSNRAPELRRTLPEPRRGSIEGEYLASMVELVSDVHTSVEVAVDELRELLAAVVEAAEPLGLEVLAAGTHPFTRGEDVDTIHAPRYDAVRERNGWWGRRLTICGTHVHLGLGGAEAAMPLVRSLADAAPLLIALSASSPFYEGEDTGFDSQRTMLFQQLGTNGLPPELEDWPAFERHAEQLRAAGMAQSAQEIRWDVRPAPALGTIEVRAADASPTLRELGCLAAWTRCLGAELAFRLEDGTRPQPLEPWQQAENKWRAARYGLEAELISADGIVPLREELERGLERLAPFAARLGCEAELEGTRRILEEGASAARQRRAAAAAGGDLRAVVESLIAETKESL